MASTENPEETAWLNSAPRSAASAIDPFRAFGHYATATVRSDTVASLAPGTDMASFTSINNDVLFIGARHRPELVVQVLAQLAQGPSTVAQCAKAAGLDIRRAIRLIAGLAKMGVLRLDLSSS